MPIDAIREVFVHGRWGNDIVFRSARTLSAGQLDQPFEMGEGSLHATLRHIYGAERNWHERVKAPGWEAFPRAGDLSDVGDMHGAACRLADAWTTWLDGLRPADLDRLHTYAFSTGETHTSRLDDILLHVYNHGVHHRAQAVNMLRHVGAPLPRYGVDYIFMYVEEPDRPAPAIEVQAVRRYFAYNDWAHRRVLDAATGLTNELLDRPFEMGLGTLRKTLVHLHDAERWWQGNWRNGPVETFPALDTSMPLAGLGERYRQTAKERDAFIASRTDADLRTTTTALARPGRTRTFPLGVTMLQLCCHGTHHRAQAVNMLRRLGAEPPELDLIGWSFTPGSA